MNLSYEAKIYLRPSYRTRIAAWPYAPPKVSFLTGHRPWVTVFSTFAHHEKGGVPSLLLSQRTGPPRGPPTQRLTVSAETGRYREYFIGDDGPAQHTVVSGRALDLQDGRASRFLETTNADGDSVGTDGGRRWEVLAWGKQGQLDAKMVDNDDGYIGDAGSGESRPDWRNCYVVVYWEGDPALGHEAGIEVWDSLSSRRLTADTFGKIKDAIANAGDKEFAGLASELKEVMSLTQ